MVIKLEKLTWRTTKAHISHIMCPHYSTAWKSKFSRELGTEELDLVIFRHKIGIKTPISFIDDMMISSNIKYSKLKQSGLLEEISRYTVVIQLLQCKFIAYNYTLQCTYSYKNTRIILPLSLWVHTSYFFHSSLFKFVPLQHWLIWDQHGNEQKNQTQNKTRTANYSYYSQKFFVPYFTRRWTGNS